MQLYDAQTIGSMKWPRSPSGIYAQNFLEPLIRNGITHYCPNIHSVPYVLHIDDHALPIVVSDSRCQENAYVCSPYSHYICYAQESSSKLIQNQFGATLMKACLTAMGGIGRQCLMDSIVYVNHWLFSTDLHPQNLSLHQIEALISYLTSQFPDHAIAFRSLNDRTTEHLQASLKKLGFHFIPSRQVFLTDSNESAIFNTRIIKSDLRLYQNSPYEILDRVQLSESEQASLLELYHALYIRDHSKLNPQFNAAFLKLISEKELLNFKIIKYEGHVLGMAGYMIREKVMLCPLFGYDKNYKENAILYRLLSISLLLEARKRNLLFHQSAGASFYKTVRRAKGYLESMAVYDRHLPFKQRIFWQGFSKLMNRTAPFYMKKY